MQWNWTDLCNWGAENRELLLCSIGVMMSTKLRKCSHCKRLTQPLPCVCVPFSFQLTFLKYILYALCVYFCVCATFLPFAHRFLEVLLTCLRCVCVCVWESSNTTFYFDRSSWFSLCVCGIYLTEEQESWFTSHRTAQEPDAKVNWPLLLNDCIAFDRSSMRCALLCNETDKRLACIKRNSLACTQNKCQPTSQHRASTVHDYICVYICASSKFDMHLFNAIDTYVYIKRVRCVRACARVCVCMRCM